ncbi:phosphodiester glycosidase family protein [Qipengyuania flava]|uniref:phosphodiester glycosidase family protein n=1 Tax=Qipengyuania flava TaxID=192812 RepID=UPI00215AA0E5|nr:phosphodiester glycosidase family protein [Qipengyuania flava]
MRALALSLALLALTACEAQPEGEPVARARIDGQPMANAPSQAPSATPTPTPTPTLASARESACRSIIFEDTPLTHCLAVPSRHSIAMELGPQGRPYRSLSSFAAASDPATIAFAMNAGMYDEEGLPIGYFVRDAERLKTLNTADGIGNFHMKPNGVFYGTDGEWVVRSTDSFLANVTERPQFGTQSGPMLVIDGAIHPEISRDGPSRLVRNAVGVDDTGRAHFVISNAPISFGKLARFYKDELEVKNALFLDGNVSLLWNPATDRLDTGAPIGPIVVVKKKAS